MMGGVTRCNHYVASQLAIVTQQSYIDTGI